MPTKILIIEDEPLIAIDLKRIVQKYQYTVTDICYNSDKSLDILAKNDYDLILLDINLQGSKNGIDLAHLINEKYQKPFIFITSFADPHTLERAKVTMPSGYVVKPFNEKEVFSSIEIANFRSLQNKEKEPSISIESINKLSKKPITEKEFAIIQDIILGKTNNQLSKEHFVSQNTIKSHIKNIYTKLDVHSKPELVAKVFSK